MPLWKYKKQLETLQYRNTWGVGIDVDLEESETLRVAWVSDGLVSAWNADNPKNSVKSGDYIIDVNGTRGSAEAMLGVILPFCWLAMVCYHGLAVGRSKASWDHLAYGVAS